MHQNSAVERASRVIEAVLGVSFLALFVYATLAWAGVLADGPTSSSGALVALTGAMLLQPVSWHVLRHSQRLGYLLVALSVAGLALSLYVLR